MPTFKAIAWQSKHALFLITLLLIFQETSCWGPYTHAAFGSLYIESHSQNTTAAAVGGNRLRGNHYYHASLLEAVFVTANSFPDAFKGTRDWMHSFEFAAFQLEQAALWTDDNPPYYNYRWQNSLEFIHTDVVKAFSFGYMLHLLEDYVGHHNQGYLNPRKDHPLELDVDTLFFHLHRHDPPPWQYHQSAMETIVSNRKAGQEIASFVSKTSQHYAKLVRDSENSTAEAVFDEGGLSLQQVERCMRRFSALLKAETYAMIANTYKNGMVRYDVCHAESFERANATLNKAINWTEGSLDVFAQNLFPFQFQTSADERDFGSTNKVPIASHAARDWVELMFGRHGGSICGAAQWEPMIAHQ